jgi:GDP-L-fucose synthase
MNVSKSDNIFLAGHKGLVGSAVYEELKGQGYKNIITRSRDEVDLSDYSAVKSFFKNLQIDHVILCAAKVGGIHANNTQRGDFILDNLSIGLNIINACKTFKVKKLINLGSSCIYPKNISGLINEEDLLTGSLEPTNEPYALAKIAVLKTCQSMYDQYRNNFFSLMPCNMYGPNDNFDLNSSHVLPGLIHKVHLAKLNNSPHVVMWGSGKPLREFLFSKDLARAIVFCLENVNAEDIYSQNISHLNCGSNEEISILDLLLKIKKIIGYSGEIKLDLTKPDGTYRKKMNNDRIFSLGFSPKFSLDEGIKQSYESFLCSFKEK